MQRKASVEVFNEPPPNSQTTRILKEILEELQLLKMAWKLEDVDELGGKVPG